MIIKSYEIYQILLIKKNENENSKSIKNYKKKFYLYKKQNYIIIQKMLNINLGKEGKI